MTRREYDRWINMPCADKARLSASSGDALREAMDEWMDRLDQADPYWYRYINARDTEQNGSEYRA